MHTGKENKEKNINGSMSPRIERFFYCTVVIIQDSALSKWHKAFLDRFNFCDWDVRNGVVDFERGTHGGRDDGCGNVPSQNYLNKGGFVEFDHGPYSGYHPPIPHHKPGWASLLHIPMTSPSLSYPHNGVSFA
jgi:hypothetical protein